MIELQEGSGKLQRGEWKRKKFGVTINCICGWKYSISDNEIAADGTFNPIECEGEHGDQRTKLVGYR